MQPLELLLQLIDLDTPEEIAAGLVAVDRACQEPGTTGNTSFQSALEVVFKSAASEKLLNFLGNSALKTPVRHLALPVVRALISLYVQASNPDILALLVKLLRQYRLVEFVGLESTGQTLRIEAGDVSFYLRTENITRDYRVDLVRLVLAKYTDALVASSPPPSQELPPLISRLHSVIGALQRLGSDNELARRATLVPFAEIDLRYQTERSQRLFGEDLGLTQYDEKLYAHYCVPLFPIIQADRLIFSGTKLTFTNEGLGCLPPLSLRIQTLLNEFEIGVLDRAVASADTCDLFLDEPDAFAGFLADQKLNADVKVVFAFKKFGRHYEYGVLANAVGNWLELASAAPRDTAIPHEIPLHDLPEKDFERLCSWIVAEDPKQRFERVRWLNEDGGGERGRDILATEQHTGKKYVFQCKRVDDFGPSQVEKELGQFATYVRDDPSIKPDVYVLVLSTAITDKMQARADALAAEIGMEIDYWPKSTIDRLVRTNRVVYDRFWREISRR